MTKRKVFLIAGVTVILVVVAGVVFVWKNGSGTPEESAKQEIPQVVEEVEEVEETRKWTEVLSDEGVQIKAIVDTTLRNEPFTTAEEVDTVQTGTIVGELAYCLDEKNNPMGWAKVEVNGVTGYLDMLDGEYVLPEVAEEEEVVEETEQESIVAVEEETETGSGENGVSEETPTEEEVVEQPVVEEPPVVAETPSEPVVETPSEPVTETTPSGSEVTTIPREQAQQQAEASVDAWLDSIGAVTGDQIPDGSSYGDNGVGGQHYGDLE